MTRDLGPRPGEAPTLPLGVAQASAKARRRLWWCFGLLVLAMIAILVLRSAHLAPSAVAAIVGVVAIYLMGACVFLGLRLRELRRQASEDQHGSAHSKSDPRQSQ
jgi:hypothetical protein